MQVAQRSNFECRPCFPAVHGAFGVCCAWAEREKRCGSVGVDRFAATEAASIAAMRVGVDLGVSHELVRVVVDGVGVLGGHGGRDSRCGDGRGSGGKILRPYEVAPKTFVFGPSGAATGPGERSPEHREKKIPALKKYTTRAHAHVQPAKAAVAQMEMPAPPLLLRRSGGVRLSTVR